MMQAFVSAPPRDGARRVRSSPFFILMLLIALALSCANARAQQSVTSATIEGRVEDARGGEVSGANVTATQIETGRKRGTTSDDAGRFRLLYLPVGAYRLRVEKTGFASREIVLTLTIGQTLDAAIKLNVAGVAEQVEVTTGDDAPTIETAHTQISETIRQREIDNLPLNGRNYLDLAALAPGVTRANPVGNQRFQETSAVPGTGLSVAGQRFLNNGFIVDGLSANDDAADLAGTFYSEEVIREFQVIASGGIAEFGRASSGFVNVVTKSGANELHGRLYGFFRNERLDARNPLAPEKDPLTQSQYGATLDSAIKRDRTFLFTNFEQTRLHNAGVITITPANLSTINSTLDAIHYQGARLTTGLFPTGFDATNLFARIDHRISDANSLAVRYSLYKINSPNARNVGGVNAVSRGTALDDTDQTIAANDITILSPRAINEARFQFTRSRLAAPTNESNAPAINISGVASFGVATFSPTARDLDTIEFVDNLTLERGAHSVKTGADFLLDRVDINFPGALEGVYAFASLADFLVGRYQTFQQAFGAPSQFQSNPNVGVFVQDEWRASDRLTLNFGVRYDLQFLPAPIISDKNNVAPRLGVAYALDAKRKTVLRAGFGLFYERIPLRATSNALQRDGSKYNVAVISFGQTINGQSIAPTFPNVLNQFPKGLLASVTTIDPHIKNAYSEQLNAQIERELTKNATLSVGYLHTRGLHLILSRNVNVPTLSATDAARLGIPNLGRPNPNFANINAYESSGDSYYDGLIVSFNSRLTSYFAARVSYTLSKAIDDAGNAFFFTPQDNFNLRDDRGLSDNDQRHRLVVSGTLAAPRGNITRDDLFHRAAAGFQLSYIFSYGSALPFNIVTGTDRNNDTNVNDRPVGVGRNTGRGFDFASLDVRLSRRFRLSERFNLETLIEGFNLLNRANLQLPNNVYGAGATPRASFGQPTAAAAPRQIQIGLRLNF